MKKTRYSEEQMIDAFREHQSGAKVEGICSKLNKPRNVLQLTKQIFRLGSERSEAST